MNKKLRNFDTNHNFESLSVGDLPEKKILNEVLQPEMKKKKWQLDSTQENKRAFGIICLWIQIPSQSLLTVPVVDVT